VHLDKLRIKQPTRCIKYPKLYFVIKLYMFRASSVPIIRSYLLYTRQLVCFTQVMWPLPGRVRLELPQHVGENKDCNIVYNVSVFSRFTKEKFHDRSDNNSHRACKVISGEKKCISWSQKNTILCNFEKKRTCCKDGCAVGLQKIRWITLLKQSIGK
jgi:hypothetical protein